MVSRTVMLHPHYRKQLEGFGFTKVTMTAADKDGLNSVIRETDPDLVIVEAGFYESSTPYMMKELLKEFPELTIAAYSFEYYPVERAMYFIVNGVKSYVTASEGIEEFNKGMALIRDGKEYISPVVLERLSLRTVYPMAARIITEREIEVVRLWCNGFTEDEIADTLYISRKTVIRHKTNVFRSLNIRSAIELVTTAVRLGITSMDELRFCHRNYVVTPLPDKQITNNKEQMRRSV